MRNLDIKGCVAFAMYVAAAIGCTAPVNAKVADENNEYAKAAATTKRNRMALIIGNAAYPKDPLPNAVRDALVMEERLRTLGFVVERYHDLDERTFKSTLLSFWGRANRLGGDAVFFYAGHGVGLSNNNYLLPIDTDLRTAEGIVMKGLSLQAVMGEQTKLNADLNRIVILDSCRNDPARGRILNGLAQGFYIADAPNSLISFSTSKEKFALDRVETGNSFFTKNLAKALLVDEIEAGALFTKVRDLVITETTGLDGGPQVPVDFNTLRKPFVFRSEHEDALSEEEQIIKHEVTLRLSKGLSAVPEEKVSKATEALYRAISIQLVAEAEHKKLTESRHAAAQRTREARLALEAKRKQEADDKESQRLAAIAENERQEAARRAEQMVIVAAKRKADLEVEARKLTDCIRLPERISVGAV